MTLRHPAIKTEHLIHGDIYQDLFQLFFDSDQYIRWREQGFENLDDKSQWQLRLTASPGYGKTTLSGIVAERLRKDIRDYEKSAVASIFIDRRVANDDTGFLACFMATLLSQLQARKTSNTYCRDDTVSELCDLGSERLRERICSALLGLDVAFLVLDGVDHCERMIADKLEGELVFLQKNGLTILATSRIPRHQLYKPRICSIHPQRLEDKRLRIFWTCKECSPSNEHAICRICRAQGATCPHCNTLSFLFEPYDHVDYELTVTEPIMRSFLQWDLEREHGDLHLNAYQGKKPPLSPVGIYLHKSGADSPKSLLNILVEDCVTKAVENVTIAKLWLPVLLESSRRPSYDVHRTFDRLPPRVCTFFQSALEPIKSFPMEQKKVALYAILATTRHGSNDSCLEWNQLVSSIARVRLSDDPGFPDIQSWSTDYVAYLTNGLLTVDYEDEPLFYPSLSDLVIYAWQDYDPDLSWMKTCFKRGSISRSKTGFIQEPDGKPFRLMRRSTALTGVSRSSTFNMKRRPTFNPIRFNAEGGLEKMPALIRRQTGMLPSG